MDTHQPDASPLTLLEEIFPVDTNPYGTAFGGSILALMDRAAGLAASRFAHRQTVTAAMDAVRFRAPVRQGEVAEIVAQVVYTSAHTCGVKLQVNAIDKISWERRSCCQATILMVAVGERGNVLRVPQLEPVTDQQRRDWDEVAEVHRRMLADRKRC